MIITEDRESVRLLTLDWPDRMNAIPPDGWRQLRDHIVTFEQSEQHVLIVSGSGHNFCAGADLSGDRVAGDVAALNEHMRVVGAAANALISTAKPTIAAVDGVAVGAGMNLALGCDVVIASTEARFSEIFAARGLTLDFGGTWLLPRLVGLQRAKELALSARIVTASEAVEIGLCLEVVERERLLPRAYEIAEQFAGGAPLAQMFIKQALNRSFELSLEEALICEGQAQAICLTSEDAKEGVAAFRQKRLPKWSSR